jgi:dihydroorotate dehydrogenase
VIIYGHEEVTMKATSLAKWEKRLRPLITKLPPETVVRKYSQGRLNFLAKLKEEIPTETYTPPESFSRILWGIKFRSPIMNSAGMFKNGECYEMVAREGAGAYIGGTGTWNSRTGNEKNGIYLPFVPYPKSHSASNWLGLPNDGDEDNSKNAAQFEKIAYTPIGWSVMGSPDLQGEKKLYCLVGSMQLYELAGVDFVEINESCPNTAHGRPQDDDLANRLKYIKQHFLDQRTRRLPVIVKFSNDTEVQQLPMLLDLLFEMGFDGVNFGNTSTAYVKMRERIDSRERHLYDFFTQTFGGGVSGRPLKEASLELASRAVEYMKKGPPRQEFHVIRTGGIESWKDIQESERAGIALNQWFTGYFEMFAKHGHDVYKKLYKAAI